MVKADVRRDYYADLGLAPSAEPDDVKKQFRKLALKYHPDRNPGKENEFNAKFQAIQAANEILSDPQQRLKYDTDRLRAGYGKFYGPPKTNPQRKAQPTSYAPTTPKSQNPKQPSARPHSSSNGPSAGAQRYATHARAGHQWQKAQDDAQTRADAYRGFQGMRGANNNNTAGWQGAGRATPTFGGPPRPPNSFAKSGRPKSAYEYFKAQATGSSPQSSKKKQGFAPGTAGGDEPMARNTSAYTSVPRSQRPTSQYFDSAPPPATQKPGAPDPFTRPSPATGFPQEFERSSSRYATSGGEKTFFSSTGDGGSTSVRTPSAGQQQHRRHSASPKGTPGGDRSCSMSTSSSDLDAEGDDDDDEDTTVPRPSAFKPKAVPKSRLRTHQKFSDFRRAEDSSPGTGHNSDSAAFPKGPRSNQHFKSQDPTSRYERFRTSAHKRKFDQTFPMSRTDTNHPFGASEHDKPNNLQKKFSVDDWRTSDFSPFDFLNVSSADKDAPGSPSSRNRGRASTQNGSSQPAQPAASSTWNPFGFVPQNQHPQPPPQQAPTPFAQARFSAQWAEPLRSFPWNLPETDKSQQSANVPPPRSTKKPTRPGTKVRSTPQPPRVASETEEVNTTINGNNAAESNQASAAEAEAMDLDDDLPPPPSMPADGAAEHSRSASYPDLSSHAGPEPAKKTQPQSQENTASNTETRTPLFNFNDLRNTAPFTGTNNGGIENLEDVHATLPFESRAKQPTTTKRDTRPRDLNIPNPPKRPRPPAPTVYPGSQQPVLPRDQWNRYVSEMNSYMREWNQFNRRMLTHFNARQEAIETGLAPGWISAVGDTARLNLNGTDDDGDSGSDFRADNTDGNDEYLIPGSGKGGFSAYLRGIEEDTQVRKHWEVACEMHRDCILNLGRLREWIRNGGRVV